MQQPSNYRHELRFAIPYGEYVSLLVLKFIRPKGLPL